MTFRWVSLWNERRRCSRWWAVQLFWRQSIFQRTGIVLRWISGLLECYCFICWFMNILSSLRETSKGISDRSFLWNVGMDLNLVNRFSTPIIMLRLSREISSWKIFSERYSKLILRKELLFRKWRSILSSKVSFLIKLINRCCQ